MTDVVDVVDEINDSYDKTQEGLTMGEKPTVPTDDPDPTESEPE